MDKQNVMYSYNGIFLARRGNEVLIHTIVWINCENITLSEKTRYKRPNIG
jgi:hypothetical protein